MLKAAWNKVKDFLPESAVEYVEGARYIKLDGTPYHTKGIKSFLHRPEVKVGMVTAVFNAAAVGLITGGVLPIALSLGISAAFIGMSSELFRYVCMDSNVGERNKQLRAIDTQGRDLSRVQLSLKDQRELEGVRGASFLIGSVMAINTIVLSEPDLALLALPYYTSALTACVSMIGRTTKLLNHDYCYCDKPPAERKKQGRETWAMGGMQQQPLPIAIPAKHKL